MNEHQPESAGFVATREVPKTTADTTVEQVLAEVESFSGDFETIDYIYVLDGQKLIGVASLHELFTVDKTSRMADVMTTDVVFVHQNSDQENVAHLALTQNIKAVPVVDKAEDFIGVVTADTILRILKDEHTEDILKYAGINFTASERLSQFTVLQHLFSRLPWLILGLIGGLLAAVVVDEFSYALEHELVLAAFIPAIVYIADAVGSQTQMVFVRSLMSPRRPRLAHILLRELSVATAVGLTLAGLAALLSWYWLSNPAVSFILFTAILSTTYFSVLVAILLPWTFDRFGKVPALASGPLATVIRDISSLSIYFYIALQLI